MKNFLTALCAVSFLFAGTSFAAQDKGSDSKHSKEVQQDTKTTTADRTAKVSTDTVYGKVESYEQGKSIKVSVPGKIISTKSFDLDNKNETVSIAPNVKTGEWVSVLEKTDNSGHKTVTVKPSSEKEATRANKNEH